MVRFRRPFFFIVFLSFSFSLSAQTTVGNTLTLDQLLQQVSEQNAAVVSARLEQKAAELQWKGTTAFFLPQLSLSAQVMGTDNALNAFGFKLQQQTVTAADFNPALLNQPGFTADFNTVLQLRQPIVNLAAFEQRKGAAAGIQAKRFQVERTQSYLRYIATQVYAQLYLAYQSESVLKRTLTSLQALLKFTQDRFDQGLLQKSDLLLVSVQVKRVETQLAEVRKGIQDASDQLATLMHVPAGTTFVPENLPVPTPVWVDSVSNQRADFQAMEAGVRALDYQLKADVKKFYPTLNGFAQYQFNDNRMFGYGAGSYLVGLQFQWELFAGNQRKNQYAQHANQRDQLATKIQSERMQAESALSQAKRQWVFLQQQQIQQQAAQEQAAEALRILQNRYQQGLVNTTDVLMAQTQLAQQELSLQQTTVQQVITHAHIQFLAQ